MKTHDLAPRTSRTTIAHDATDIAEVINANEIANYRLGVALIVLSIACWISGLELVNVVVKGDSYVKPWLFAVIVGTSFSLNYLPDVFRCWKRNRCEEMPLLNVQSSNSSELTNCDGCKKVVELSTREFVILALKLTVVYFGYNSCILQSLQYTSASNQTVIGTTSTMFCLIIGVLGGFERYSYKKLACVGGSLFGVFLVNFSAAGESGDGKGKYESKNPFLGNSIALGGALFYALYLIIMKIECGNDRTCNERQLFGLVGVFTLLAGVPLLILFDVLGVEKLERPPNWQTTVAVVINGVFSVASDYTAVLAMLLTSPLVVSLSLTSAIPITIFIDYVVVYVTTHKQEHLGYLYFLGILCMLMAVILINVNITTENELIGDLIDDTLESAMKVAPSPQLSEAFSPRSPYIRQHLQNQLPIGLKYGFSPFVGAKVQSKPSHNVSGLNLNDTFEEDHEAIFNRNHSNLYTIGMSSEESNSQPPTRPPPNPLPRVHSGLVVLSGRNHSYNLTPYACHSPPDNV
ncbi:hypothetical protein DICA4_D03686 [Diutina catenulata]